MICDVAAALAIAGSSLEFVNSFTTCFEPGPYVMITGQEEEGSRNSRQKA